MKKLSILIFALANLIHVFAQETATNNTIATPTADRTVQFNISAQGVAKPIVWGLDLAWLDEMNVRRGIEYMGRENVNLIRSSFIPSNPISNGALQGDALTNTNLRISYIKRNLGTAAKIVLNSDHPSVDPYFYGNAANWAELIDVTTTMHQNAGLEVVTVSPFNEPDLSSTGQGTIDHFYNIILELRKNSKFDNIRISGGNTLNNDKAATWYNYLNPAGLDEGNTHQLAGSFDNYASFYETVRAAGDHATNDELHNVMEAMVGVEYGMQTGIWWGTAEYARGEFCKASNGVRLAYAEHRPNWSAASVYKTTEGKVQAFVGASERQGVSTSFRFVSTDRDVYFDGVGPQREFIMELPTGDPDTYQTAKHTNGERVINITWGDDIQPVINGKYILVNRNSGKVLEAANGSTSNATNIQQNTANGATYQQWNVTPIDARNGGDFSYFLISGVPSNKFIDNTNSSMNNNNNIIMYEKGTWWDGRHALNQVWYLEYAEDGWFYIRNQFSAKCLHVANSSTSNGANIIQWEKNGSAAQQWRFVPIDATVELNAPKIPTGLVATSQANSILLSWDANSENDLAGYTVLRSEQSGSNYQTIARNVSTTSFVDHTAAPGKNYYYALKAVDKALNSSIITREVTAKTTKANDVIAKYLFEENTLDSSINLNHSSVYGTTTFTDGRGDSKAIVLNGDDNFIQLPATIANHKELSIATWVNWQRGILAQSIFNFSTDDSHYLYLTPVNNSGKMSFAMKNGEEEVILDVPYLNYRTWKHVAVTIGESTVAIYVDGVKVGENTKNTISPNDIKPIFNYIGRGHNTSDRLFNGYFDDFQVFNYKISDTKVAQLAGIVGTNKFSSNNELELWPNPANTHINVSVSNAEMNAKAQVSIVDLNGRKLLEMPINEERFELNVTEIPNGIYLLHYTNSETTQIKRFIVQH